MSEFLRATNSNTDLLGDTWSLAAGGHRLIEQSRSGLWDLRHELLGISTLLQSLGPDPELDGGGLYGIGVTLGRISRRLGKIHDRLERAETAEPGPATPALHSLSR